MTIDAQLRAIYDMTQISMLYERAGDVRMYAGRYYCADFFPSVKRELMLSGLNAAYTMSMEYIAFGLIRASDYSLFIGPAPALDVADELIKEALKYVNLPLDRETEFLYMLRATPLYDIKRFHAIMRYIGLSCFNQAMDEIPFIDYPAPIVGAPVAAITKPPPPLFDLFSYKEHDFRERVMSAIEYGEIDDVVNELSHMGREFIYTINRLPTETEMHDKFILALAFASQAAISGGLNNGNAELMIDHYLKLISRMPGFRDMVRLFKSMLIDFATRVHRAQLPACDDALTRRILIDVENHLHEKLTPSLIAARLNMNVAYLCTHFRENCGKTISTYINERKIRESQYLLCLPGASVTSVAMQLGYTTPNYYGTVFKKILGTSPAEYRRRHAEAKA